MSATSDTDVREIGGPKLHISIANTQVPSARNDVSPLPSEVRFIGAVLLIGAECGQNPHTLEGNARNIQIMYVHVAVKVKITNCNTCNTVN